MMNIKIDKARAIRSLLILILFVISITPLKTAKASASSEPAYGVALVDGDYSEWDLAADFYANMYRAGNSGKPIESKLYVRYDCATQTLYVLVLAEPGIPILAAGWEVHNFIKWGNSIKLVDGNNAPPDGILPDFQWINLSHNPTLGEWVADGWEAAVYVPVNRYENLNVHAQVYDGGSQTSAVSNRSIPISMTCYDFGDLPESPSVPAYNITTLANDGARHIPGNIFLGSRIDMEHDGMPNQLATGDDNNGSGDEDGVVRVATPPNYWSQGQGAVNVTVTGGMACLSAWMDFWNHNLNEGLGDLGTDGDFTDVGPGWSENIINNMSLSPGTTTINFPLPIDAATYPVYARFRLMPDADGDGDCSDQPAPQLTGLMINGEVEDYSFNFKETAVTLADFTANPIRTNHGVVLPAILSVGLLGFFWHSRRSR